MGDEAAPAGEARYHPVVDALVSARTRKGWVSEVLATEFVELANGGAVRPDAHDVTVITWGIVWVPA